MCDENDPLTYEFFLGPKFRRKSEKLMTQHDELLNKIPEYDGKVWPDDEIEREISIERLVTETGYLNILLETMDRVMKYKSEKWLKPQNNTN